MGKFIQTYNTFVTGQNADIDQTAEVLTATSFQPKFGIYIKAEADNANNVFVGLNNTLTINNGFRLDAGEEVFIPFSGDVATLYVIADADNQAVSFLAI